MFPIQNGVNCQGIHIKSIYGTQASLGDQLTIHVEIPFNTEATIILPTGQLEKIIESPQECTFKKEGNSIGCNVGSGIYRYVIHYDK